MHIEFVNDFELIWKINITAFWAETALNAGFPFKWFNMVPQLPACTFFFINSGSQTIFLS